MRNKYQGERVCDHAEKDTKKVRQVYFVMLAFNLNLVVLEACFNWNVHKPLISILLLSILLIVPSAGIFYLFSYVSRAYYLDEEGFTVQHFLLFRQRVSWTQIKEMREVYIVVDKTKPPKHWIVWSKKRFPRKGNLKSSWIENHFLSCYFVTFTDQAYELLNRYYGVDKTQES